MRPPASEANRKVVRPSPLDWLKLLFRTFPPVEPEALGQFTPPAPILAALLVTIPTMICTVDVHFLVSFGGLQKK